MPDGGTTIPYPWIASLYTLADTVVGAGIVVGRRSVLTCAHVVEEATRPRASGRRGAPEPPSGADAATVLVRLVNAPVPALGARVRPGCWFPAYRREGASPDAEFGDVALLELDAEVPEPCVVALSRRHLRHGLPVRTFGFPVSAPTGVWADATLAGPGGPGGEWHQLNVLGTGAPIAPGFSGGAVLQAPDGPVVGMVACKYDTGGRNIAWMITVDTVLGYLPVLAERAGGTEAVDPALAGRLRPVHDHTQTGKTINDFLARRAPEPMLAVVTGPTGSAESAELVRAVTFAAARSGSGGSDDRDGTAPLPGSLDLALDATGLGLGEVCRRIAVRAALPGRIDTPKALLDSDVPPMTLVVDGVDAAAEPLHLTTLLVKLLEATVAGGGRLLLAFRGDVAGAEDAVKAARDAAEAFRDHPVDPRSLEEDLRSCEDRLHQVWLAEEAATSAYERVKARILDPERPRYRHPMLLARLPGLRGLVSDPPPRKRGAAPRKIAAWERDADAAIAAAQRAQRETDGLVARRDELRGALAAHQVMAERHGLGTDRELGDLFANAADLLWHGRCNLALAEKVVGWYVATVQRRCAGTVAQGPE